MAIRFARPRHSPRSQGRSAKALSSHRSSRSSCRSRCIAAGNSSAWLQTTSSMRSAMPSCMCAAGGCRAVVLLRARRSSEMMLPRSVPLQYSELEDSSRTKANMLSPGELKRRVLIKGKVTKPESRNSRAAGAYPGRGFESLGLEPLGHCALVV
eukprot:5740934-Prymnesium_polylepis.5